MINRSCGWPAQDEAWPAQNWIFRGLLARNGKKLNKNPGSFSRFVKNPGSCFRFIKNPGSFFQFIKNPGSFFLFNQNPGSFSRFIQKPGSFFQFIKNLSSISTYQLDQNIRAHPRHLNFNACTRPKYSCAPSIPPFLGICTYSTKIFLRFLDSSIFTYQLDHHAKLCNVCYCLQYLVLCYPRRYNPWKFSWFWLERFSVWLCSLDQWMRCCDWSTTIFVRHSGTIDDLWNHSTIFISSMNQHHPPLYLFHVFFFCFSNWTCVNCSAICRFTVAEQKSIKIIAQMTGTPSTENGLNWHCQCQFPTTCTNPNNRVTKEQEFPTITYKTVLMR